MVLSHLLVVIAWSIEYLLVNNCQCWQVFTRKYTIMFIPMIEENFLIKLGEHSVILQWRLSSHPLVEKRG